MRAGVHRAAVEMPVSQARLGSWSMACDTVIDVGWSVKAEGKLHMSLASERCSARTPARDVKSALGRSVDVRDSMENMVSVMIGPLVPSAQTKMDHLSYCIHRLLQLVVRHFVRGRRCVRCPSE